MNNLQVQIDEELKQIPLSAEVRSCAFYSEAEWDVFQVNYNSAGGYRLFAWMSVPKGGGLFPGVIMMPEYGSASTIPYSALRYQAVVLNPTYRGQRRSDVPFEAHYPGLLTEGLESADTYIMRGIYADAIRSVDFLVSRSEVAAQPVAVTGHGLGGALALLAAASRPEVVRVVACDSPLMIGGGEHINMARSSPLDEFADYLRLFPAQQKSILEILEYYNLEGMAHDVSQPVLMSVGLKDQGQCPPQPGKRLSQQIKEIDLREYPDAGGEGGGWIHDVIRDNWIREKLELPTQ